MSHPPSPRPRAPHLTIDDIGRNPTGIVLVLHGGSSQSHLPVMPLSLAYLRMIPFAHRIKTQASGRLVVARLRNRVRGWNDAEQSSLHDARWAIDQLTARFGPLPIGLVGHSLGGRTAVRAAGDEHVRSVVGLAPWLPPGEPIAQLAGREVLLAHGTADRITSAPQTALYAARLRAAGVRTTHLELPGGHSMLRGAPRWHRLAAEFTVDALLTPRYDRQPKTHPTS